MIRMAIFALFALTMPAAAQSGNQLPAFADRFAALAPFTAQTPLLKPAASITGEIVRIGDLVENAGAVAEVPIFRAPDLGQTGSVAASRIVDAVLPHGIVDLDLRGLTEVVVTRASHAITPADLEARIARALAGRQLSTEAGSLSVAFDSEVRTIHVEPDTDLRIARMSFEPRSGRFDVLFDRGGRNRSLIRFTGTYAETFEAVVLARSLASGEVVRAADVTTMRRPKSESAGNAIGAHKDAVGMVTRRALRTGQVLRQSDLTKQELVARNDNVTITYEVPGIVLTMGGKALEAGAQGDAISVMNMQSRRQIQAIVAGPGHVVVVAPRISITSAPAAASRVAANAPPAPQAPRNAE
jgi:flagella basal body P-ring formation protein FlgA